MHNINRILEATHFATLAHEGQIRKYEGHPYVMHCMRVAKTVAGEVWPKHYDAEDMVIAALLHDVIEDCYIVFHEAIREKFGNNVYQMVKALTHPPLTAGNRAVRKRIERDQLWNADERVHTIKLADTIDNIPSIVENDKDFAPRFVKEKLELIPGLNKGSFRLLSKAMVMINEAAEKFGLEPAVYRTESH